MSGATHGRRALFGLTCALMCGCGSSRVGGEPIYDWRSEQTAVRWTRAPSQSDHSSCRSGLGEQVIIALFEGLLR